MKRAESFLTSKPGQIALLGLGGYLQVANAVADITLSEDMSDSTLLFESSNAALVNVAVLSEKLYRRVNTQVLLQLEQLQDTSIKALNGLYTQITLLELVKNWEHSK